MKLKLFVRFFSVLSVFVQFTEPIYSQKNFYPSDTIWRRTVYRVLDLELPKNRALRHFPDSVKSTGQSLIDIILYGVETYAINAYKEVERNRFYGLVTLEEIYSKLGAQADTFWVDDDLDESTPEVLTVAHSDPDKSSIIRYEIIQEYFFVKKTSSFQNRIIGIRPIRKKFRELDYDDEVADNEDEQDFVLMQLGWYKFEELEHYLEMTRLKKSANQNSFSNYLRKFESGDFESYIIEINNDFGVGITDYTDAENQNKPSLQMILESRRIEYEFYNFELNLWEY